MSPTSAGGFLSRSEVVKRYESLTGRDASRIAYYQAFQFWRLAAIVEGVLSRYSKGVMGDGDANTEVFRMQVDALAQSAVTLLDEL